MPTSVRPKKIIIAIDGPAGSGKSSTAKALAKKLKLPFIDTGAMYRAVTLKALRSGISFDDKKALVVAAKSARIQLRDTPSGQKVFLDGKDVTRAIREPELTKKVVYVAREPLVRRQMVKKQRLMGQVLGGVMEGRDIGTKVFPKADFKFFFVANPRIRALRRVRELRAAGKKATLAQILKDQKIRDRSDTQRKEGPLRRAKDAIRLDTSSLTIEETVDKILALIRQ